MVPAQEYDALKGKAAEFETLVSNMVPREQLEASEAKVKELQAALQERVPQSTYDELVYRVVQLAQEVTGGEAAVGETEAPPQAESSAPETETGETATPQAAEDSTPEIREVATQLVEIKASTEEATAPEPPQAEPVVGDEHAVEQPEAPAEVAPAVAESAVTAESGQES